MTISFDELFALRIMLQDDILDENTIIRELKSQLILSGMPPLTIPVYLKDFYSHFGINISIDDINEAITSSTDNIMTQLFSFELPEDDNNDEDNDDDNEEDNNYHEESNPLNFLLTNLISQIHPGAQVMTHNNIISALINLGTQTQTQTSGDVIATLDETENEKLKRYKPEIKLEEKCAICLSEQDIEAEVCELPCNHTFHSECIDTYLKEYNYKCPVCRKEVGKAKYNI